MNSQVLSRCNLTRLLPWLLVVVAVSAYWPCMHGPFLWDDRDWTTEVEWVMKDLNGLRLIWMVPTTLQQYYPVTATSFWLDYQLWGWNPFAFHLTNVIAHGICGVFFGMVLKRLEVPGAWLAATLLVVHPMMVESVGWITERKNVLAMLFFLASLIAFGRYWSWWSPVDSRRQSRWWILGALLFILALLSKITAFVLPPSLLVICWWKTGRIGFRRDLIPTLPLFLVSIALGIAINWMETNHIGAKGEIFEISWLDRFVLSGQAICFYILKLAWPHPLCVIYYRWELDASQVAQWAGVLGVLMIMVTLAWSRQRGIWAAFLFFVGALFPVLGFLSVYGMRYAWVADRWVQLPALALFALGGVAVWRIRSSWLRGTIAVFIAFVSFQLTRQQTALYSNLDTFWMAAISENKNAWVAHNEYSDALMVAGRLDEALFHIRESIRLAPHFAEGHSNQGNILQARGQFEDALHSYDEALRLLPNHAGILYNRGTLLRDIGQLKEAEEDLRRAIEKRGDFLAAHNDLGNLMLTSGKFGEAKKHFLRALELRPSNPNANTSLGNVYYMEGDYLLAKECFEAALASDPNQLAVLSNYAWMLATTADEGARDGARAVALASRAADLTKHQDVGVLSCLAAAYAEAGDFSKAAETIDHAIQRSSTAGQNGATQNLRAMGDLFESGKSFRIEKP